MTRDLDCSGNHTKESSQLPDTSLLPWLLVVPRQEPGGMVIIDVLRSLGRERPVSLLQTLAVESPAVEYST